MDSTSSEERGRILGIGGIFFKAADAPLMRGWYQEKLGIENGEHGAMFHWRSAEAPEKEQMTIWSIFPATSKYFEPSQSTFMMNYIVDDLEALLAKLDKAGVSIDPKRENVDYGRFAWIYDPEGNKIELWEPLGS